MNQTHLEHAGFALLMQLPFAVLGHWWLGAAFGAAFFIGREHAQAEYRWIKMFGGGHRANLPMFGGLDWRVWRNQYDAWLDWVIPTLACMGLACAVEYGL